MQAFIELIAWRTTTICSCNNPVRKAFVWLVTLWMFASAVAAREPLIEPLIVDEADIIAMGTVTSISTLAFTSVPVGNRTFPARRQMAVLIIDQVFKGPADLRSVRFELFETDSFVGYPETGAGAYRIFFLKRVDGDYEFADSGRSIRPYRQSRVGHGDLAESWSASWRRRSMWLSRPTPRRV